MNKKIHPRNYNFFWLVYNATYFFISCFLTSNYLKRDFIVIYQNGNYKLYASKEETGRLAKYGLLFFRRNFNDYKKKVNGIIKEAKTVFKLNKTKNFSNFSDREIRVDFLRAVGFAQRALDLYWFTEYFLYDEIERRVKQAPSQNKLLVKRVKEMQELKYELRKSVINRISFLGDDYFFKNYLDEIEKRAGRRDLASLHCKEIADLLKGKTVDKVNRRDCILGKFNNWQPITGKKALAIIKLFSKDLDKKQKSNFLKGQVANPGRYKGRVRLINFDQGAGLSREVAKFKEGEVLVTGSTIPQMILACRKAGAIITEEGGITSHAAIVSRELNKPCVIATKIATQVLKNGDMVEVDADKGIVKIIKNNK
ncbi:MAG: PEP-utilizing enzyme [Patescibacteria group bacterium]|nr:PEP-utilizing enzyme [Patescibacteria group bacterium]